MTFLEAQEFVRELIDESHQEFFSDGEVSMAIIEAQIALARQYWNESEREPIRPLYIEEQFNAPTAILSLRHLAIDAVLSEMKDSEGATQGQAIRNWLHASYQSPAEYSYFRGERSFAQSTSKQLIWTMDNNTIRTNGIALYVTYYRMPSPFLLDGAQLELALPYHCAICSYAAYLLYQKEVPIGDDKRRNSRPSLLTLYT